MVTQTQGTGLSFRVFMPDAGRVELVGSFTAWREGAVEMTRDPMGWWSVELDVGPGDHEFQYLVDGQHWLADYAAGGLRMNKFGTWVSLLHTPLEEEESYLFEPATEVPLGSVRVAA